jgi:DNA-binding HxlR family transcriptional regulator
MEPGILPDTSARPFRRRAAVPQDCPRPEDCPVQVTLDVIGGRWKPLALYHLRGGTRRFNELRRMMPGVTQRMLTATLRELERDGIIRREVFPEVPPRVEYTTTALGESLFPILDAMAAWGGRAGRPAS